MRRWAGIPVAALLLWCVPAAASAHSGAARAGETVLVEFGAADAGPQSGVTQLPSGALAGTSEFGGTHANGTVFELVRTNAGYRMVTLHTFRADAAGAKPAGNVSVDSGGNLFGATVIGGTANAGTLFELARGSSGYTFSVLADFAGGSAGNQPVGTPLLDPAGDIFETTQFGGLFGQGAVVEFKPSGAGYAETVLHSFQTSAGGYLPQAGLTMDASGALYGTTYYGGTSACSGGCGTVFRLSPSAGGYRFSVVHAFDGADGSNPYGTLAVDSTTGDVYGTTEYGGTGCSFGCGTVFLLAPSGTTYAETVLHGFTAGADGLLPNGGLLLQGVTLYGTSQIGGTGCHQTGCGVVWSVGTSGIRFHVLHDFAGPPDGAGPDGTGLILTPRGLLGTTNSGGNVSTCADGGPGGVHGCGTLFDMAVAA